MKHWKLILGILVVFILVDLAFTIFLSNKNSSNVTSTPITNTFADTTSPNNSLSTFTTNCFTSYIQAYMQDQQNANPGAFDKNASSCFTSDFIQQWPAIIANSESDPVLISQDYDSSWATNVTTSITSQTATTATALVNIGAGTESMQLLAQLQNTSAGWRIASVSRPQ